MAFAACFGMRGTSISSGLAKALIPLALLSLSVPMGAFASESARLHPTRSKAKRSAAAAKSRTRFRVRRAKRLNMPRYQSDEGEDVEGRLNWFMFQRSYPFNSVPGEARRRAWEMRPG